jgi:hypothetical protein
MSHSAAGFPCVTATHVTNCATQRTTHIMLGPCEAWPTMLSMMAKHATVPAYRSSPSSPHPLLQVSSSMPFSSTALHSTMAASPLLQTFYACFASTGCLAGVQRYIAALRWACCRSYRHTTTPSASCTSTVHTAHLELRAAVRISSTSKQNGNLLLQLAVLHSSCCSAPHSCSVPPVFSCYAADSPAGTATSTQYAHSFQSLACWAATAVFMHQ